MLIGTYFFVFDPFLSKSVTVFLDFDFRRFLLFLFQRLKDLGAEGLNLQINLHVHFLEFFLHSVLFNSDLVEALVNFLVQILAHHRHFLPNTHRYVLVHVF
jgi:hypothetical protein